MPIISEEILHDLKINTLIYLVSINTYIDRTNEIVLKGRNKLVICVISFKEMDSRKQIYEKYFILKNSTEIFRLLKNN